MSDRIDFGDRPWTAIPRSVLRDSSLSPRAKGGLVTLLSHDDGWVRSVIAVLQRECRCGRQQAQAIMKELRAAGYADLVSERSDAGKLLSHYVVRAEPAPSLPGTSGVSVAGGPARRESRPPVTQAAVVDPREVDPQDVDPQVQLPAPAPRPRDEEWEAFLEETRVDQSELSEARRDALNGMLATIRRLTPGITAPGIRARAREWRQRYPNVGLTPETLVRRWAELGKRQGSLSRIAPSRRVTDMSEEELAALGG